MSKLKEFVMASARPLPVIILADISGSMSTNGKIDALNDAIEAKMLEHTLIHRLGEPQDMANAALFLCSPAAA